MRFTKSFLISLNLHIWSIGLVSLVWVLARPDVPKEPLEVKFFRLPREAAAVEGERSAPPELVGLEVVEEERERLRSLRSSPSPSRSGHGQPLVTYRVRIAKERPDRDVIRRGMRPQADEGPAFGPEPSFARAAPPTAGQRVDRVSEEISFRGDTRPLLEIIQARIDAVTPLAHASAVGCMNQSGIVKIAFRINTLGYPCGMRIVRSSGCSCLDDEVDNVLHLAEPYPYLAGWVPVTVRFTL